MSKKELRKQLELAIIKATEDILNNHNAKAAQKIQKTVKKSSKTVAKKFYKAVKQLAENTIVTEVKKTAVPVKKSAVSRLKIKTAASTAKVKK